MKSLHLYISLYNRYIFIYVTIQNSVNAPILKIKLHGNENSPIKEPLINSLVSKFMWTTHKYDDPYFQDDMPTGVLKWSSSHSSYGYATQDNRERISENTTESVRVDSSFHVAEIVGKQGVILYLVMCERFSISIFPFSGHTSTYRLSIMSLPKQHNWLV